MPPRAGGDIVDGKTGDTGACGFPNLFVSCKRVSTCPACALSISRGDLGRLAMPATGLGKAKESICGTTGCETFGVTAGSFFALSAVAVARVDRDRGRRGVGETSSATDAARVLSTVAVTVSELALSPAFELDFDLDRDLLGLRFFAGGPSLNRLGSTSLATVTIVLAVSFKPAASFFPGSSANVSRFRVPFPLLQRVGAISDMHLVRGKLRRLETLPVAAPVTLVLTPVIPVTSTEESTRRNGRKCAKTPCRTSAPAASEFEAVVHFGSRSVRSWSSRHFAQWNLSLSGMATKSMLSGACVMGTAFPKINPSGSFARSHRRWHHRSQDSHPTQNKSSGRFCCERKESSSSRFL